MTTNPNDHRESVAGTVLAAVVALTTLGALLTKVVGPVIGTVVTATGHPLLVGLGAAVAAALAGLGRWTAGRVRERREEAADALAAAAWRAEHLPHLALQIDGARISSGQVDQDRAGVA